MRAAAPLRPPALRLALLLALLSLGSAGAHPRASERLAALDRRASQSRLGACEGALKLARGDVLRRQGQLSAALAQYEAARRCPDADPRLVERAWLARAATLLRAGRPAAAEAIAGRLLRAGSGGPEALLVRARARRALRRPGAAAADLEAALGRLRDPQPDHYFEWARACEAAGDLRAARAALDEGLRRLGPLAALAQEAVRIEVRARRFDAALELVGRMLQSAPPREAWLVQRADLLSRAGRPAEAAAAYDEALTALRLHPRRTQAVLALEAEARSARARLAGTRSIPRRED